MGSTGNKKAEVNDLCLPFDVRWFLSPWLHARHSATHPPKGKPVIPSLMEVRARCVQHAHTIAPIAHYVKMSSALAPTSPHTSSQPAFGIWPLPFALRRHRANVTIVQVCALAYGPAT